ncbi:MAG: hypothetical protein KatS3mg130_1316 [Candidatus Sumerlaea sp.]|nr:MAG: hypothetical protein KatS3mg130_1316 [Candidatus Sumerlaea sp.]
MLQRPNAERVLLLGAPIPEIIAELLRYPRLQVDCVHPDDRLIRQIEKVAPHVLKRSACPSHLGGPSVLRSSMWPRNTT